MAKIIQVEFPNEVEDDAMQHFFDYINNLITSFNSVNPTFENATVRIGTLYTSL